MADNSSMIVGDVNISGLSDEELFQRLTGLGAVVGPIVCTTRKIYERKLAVLMGATFPNCSLMDSVNETYNEDDGSDVEPSEAYIKSVSGESVVRQRNPISGLSGLVPNIDKEEEGYNEDDFDIEEQQQQQQQQQQQESGSRLYTPSPRRPIRSPDSSYSSRHQEESYLSSPTAATVTTSSSSSGTSKQHADDTTDSQTGSSILPKIIFVAILAVLIYFFFIAKSEKDAFASLEHIAQTAADSMEKSKGKPAA